MARAAVANVMPVSPSPTFASSALSSCSQPISVVQIVSTTRRRGAFAEAA